MGGGTAGAAHSDEGGGVVWKFRSSHRDSVVVEVSGVARGVGGASVCIVGVCCCSAAISARAERNMSLRSGSWSAGCGTGSGVA